MSTRTILHIIIMWSLAIIGTALVWYATSWHVILGIYLMMWSNNIGTTMNGKRIIE